MQLHSRKSNDDESQWFCDNLREKKLLNALFEILFIAHAVFLSLLFL